MILKTYCILHKKLVANSENFLIKKILSLIFKKYKLENQKSF